MGAWQEKAGGGLWAVGCGRAEAFASDSGTEGMTRQRGSNLLAMLPPCHFAFPFRFHSRLNCATFPRCLSSSRAVVE